MSHDDDVRIHSNHPSSLIVQPSANGREPPIEVAFLKHYGVSAAVLELAGQVARTSGVTAERVLLGEGLMSAHRFYELLARHLELPYLHHPLPIAGGIRLDQQMQAEIASLAPNAEGLAYVVAPRGETLVRLLQHVEAAGPNRRSRVAVTSPQRLAALIRLHHRAAILRDASHGLPDWNDNLSARSGSTLRQRAVGLVLGAALAGGAGLAPAATFAAASLLFSLLFFTMVGVRLLATLFSREIAAQPPARTPGSRLPVYTVVVPLYRESTVVPQLIAALSRLDYPPSRLDIKIVVETGDRATLDALQAERLPGRFEILMAPPGYPQTKPRALNVALRFAEGCYLVVFDAEDVPDPGQLRAAAARFEQADDMLACLQARLAIDNSRDSWLSAIYALEYAALFDVINPGLARLELPIALGGTSNHFRTETLRRVNGWDAWNVTEDIDLGIRLARFGYRVDVLASSTYEEAPHRLNSWLGQRRRWQKGWIVTLRTHSRHPGRLFAELGLAGGLAAFATLCGTIASSLLGPFFMAAIVLDAMFGPLLSPQTAGQKAWSCLALLLLVLGIISLYLPLWLGLRRRSLMPVLGFTLLMPAYLLLVSIATWQALFEMLGQPFAWEKTQHGTAKHRERPASGAKTPLRKAISHVEPSGP